MRRSDHLSVPFPKELYDKIIIRSGGKVDPVDMAIYQLEEWIERTLNDEDAWTEEGFEEWQLELAPAAKGPSLGDPTKGYHWKELYLPNGSELRMTYRGQIHHAQVRNEKLVYEGNAYSPSKLASKIAGDTGRNAWRDLWIKFPGQTNWDLAIRLRRREQKTARS
jgi:hypothetical protein